MRWIKRRSIEWVQQEETELKMKGVQRHESEMSLNGLF